MKKVIVTIATAMFLISCGGSEETKPIETTYDSVGVDSSMILPPLVDSINKVDTVDGNAILKVVE